MLNIHINRWANGIYIYMVMRGKLPTANIPRGFSTQTQNISGPNRF